METTKKNERLEREERRTAELSKGYTKADLIRIIISREEDVTRWTKEVSRLSEELKTLKENATSEVMKAVKDVHNEYYKDWCKQNDMFLKRYMDSYLKKALKVKVKGDYGNCVSVSLLVNGQLISEDSDYAIDGANPLDE